MMKKNMLFLYLILLAAFFGIASIAMYVISDRAFDECAVVAKSDAPVKPKPGIKIAIIGDSWVTDKKLDQAVSDEISASGIQVEVASSGQPGAVSRQVYRNLTSDETTPYSCKHLLLDKHIDFIVIVAGINDTVEHIGRDYYAHHMLCIIRAIQARGIHPVIVEIPEYGIEITPPKSFQNYVKRLVYRMVYDGGRHDVILAYREALLAGLTPDMKHGLTIVEYAPLSTSYNDTLYLYDNPNHLNEKGYSKLGHMIAQAILKAHKNRRPPNELVCR